MDHRNHASTEGLQTSSDAGADSVANDVAEAVVRLKRIVGVR